MFGFTVKSHVSTRPKANQAIFPPQTVKFLRPGKSPSSGYQQPYRRSFLIFGDLRTAALLRLRSFSMRPLVMLHVLPERGVRSLGMGSELGWHSSRSMARSGVLFARHCNLISAVRCRLRRLCDEHACASSDNDGLGEDVALKSVIPRSYNAGSNSTE